MKLTSRGRGWALITAGIAVFAIGLAGCGAGAVDAEARCYADGYKVAVTALETGVPTNTMPASCDGLSPAKLDQIGADLRAQLLPMLYDTTGKPTAAYASLLVAQGQVTV